VNQNCTKKQFFEAAFPERVEFNDSSLRSLNSELYGLILKFYKAELNDGLETDLMKGLLSRGLYNDYQKYRKKYLKSVLESKVRDENYYAIRYEISKNDLSFYASKEQRQIESIDSALKEISLRLDEKYIVQKFQLIAEMKNRGTNEPQNVISHNQLQKLINSGHLFEQNSFINIYGQLLNLLENNDDDLFKKLYSDLQLNQSQFRKTELKDMFEYLQNYCIQKINKGSDKHLSQLFELYRYQLENDILIDGNTMRVSDFKNIATVGIRSEDYDWVAEFTTKYQDHLNEKYQQSAVAYNLARIDFYNGLYNDALRKLLNVEYADVYYELSARALLIKIYFEISDDELMMYNHNSLKIFIQRSKVVSVYQKTLYTNFLKCVQKFQRLIDGDKRVMKALDHLIYEEKSIADYSWVRQKYEELKE
jgi:hypothetical protein